MVCVDETRQCGDEEVVENAPGECGLAEEV
jgi:hypothetical protein